MHPTIVLSTTMRPCVDIDYWICLKNHVASTAAAEERISIVVISLLSQKSKITREAALNRLSFWRFPPCRPPQMALPNRSKPQQGT
jgi:hypothetical protein